MSTRYDDIIDLPRVITPGHRAMAMENRAAQFAPFAALTGYDAAVLEAARYTDRRIELDESAREALDQRLRLLWDHIIELPEITVTYFIPDTRKSGGAYRTVTGHAKRLRQQAGTLELQCGEVIPLEEVISLQGGCFAPLELY